MYTLGRSTRRTMKTTNSKRRMEATSFHRCPQKFNTGGRSTITQERTRQAMKTIHSNTTTITIKIRTKNVVTWKINLLISNWAIQPGSWNSQDVWVFSRHKEGCLQSVEGGCRHWHGWSSVDFLLFLFLAVGSGLGFLSTSPQHNKRMFLPWVSLLNGRSCQWSFFKQARRCEEYFLCF